MSADWEPGHRDPVADDSREERPPERRGVPVRPSDVRDRPREEHPGEVPDAGRVAWLIVGALAIAAGTALGWDATALSALVTPQPIIRAALIGLAVGVAIVLLLGALNRLAGDADDMGRASAGRTPRDIGALIRGVRLVFLAVAALAAAAGWVLGHPLPLVVALIIAGVDVLETSFLLLVVGLRGGR